MTKYDYFSQDPNFPTGRIITALFIGAFLSYLNETLLNVALTPIMQDFQISKTTVQWSTTGFLLVMGALTPLSAGLMQWFNSRQLALLTNATFLIGSLICSFAPNFTLLLIGRIVQASAAAISVPLLMTTILAIYPPEKRGKIMGLVTLVFTAAPAIGPTLSGVIVDYVGWRYLFLFTVPFVALAMLFITRYLTINLNDITRPKIDLLSISLSILGFGGLVFACSHFSTLTLSHFLGLLGISFALIGWFAKRQFQLAEPLLNLRAFQYSQFRNALLFLTITVSLFIGLEIALPMYAQQVLQFSGTTTGLMLMPASIVTAIFAPIFGSLLDKKGGRAVILPGAILILISLTLLAFYAEIDSHIVVLSAIFGLFALAISIAITSETHALNSLPKALNSHGTAILGTINPILGALGAALFVGMINVGENLAPQAEPRLAMLNGVQLAFYCAVGLSMVGLFFALKVKK